MGHRKHSQPRRGSLSISHLEDVPKAWRQEFEDGQKINSEEPKLLAHVGFKAGCVQIVSIDDREQTPNAGKQLVSLGTVLVTPPVFVLGIRGYTKDQMVVCMQNLMFLQKIFQKKFQNKLH